MEDKNKAPEEATLEESNVAGSSPPSTKGPLDKKQLDDGKQPPARNPLGRLGNFANLYLVLFLVLLLIGGAVILVAVKTGNKTNNKSSTKSASLTDKQIAALKGSTTIVGDAQQVLDIQGSSVFEGQ